MTIWSLEGAATDKYALLRARCRVHGMDRDTPGVVAVGCVECQPDALSPPERVDPERHFGVRFGNQFNQKVFLDGEECSGDTFEVMTGEGGWALRYVYRADLPNSTAFGHCPCGGGIEYAKHESDGYTVVG